MGGVDACRRCRIRALSRTLRVLGAAARELARQTATARAFTHAGRRDRRVPVARRAGRSLVAADETRCAAADAGGRRSTARCGGCSSPADDADAVREPDGVARDHRRRPRSVRRRARRASCSTRSTASKRPSSSARLAQRVSDLTRGADEGQPPAIVAVWPPDRQLRPGALPAARSRQAGGVELPAAALQPRAALDGAADRRRSHQEPRAHAVAAARVAADGGAARSAVSVDAAACRRARADRPARRPAPRALGAGRAVSDDRARSTRCAVDGGDGADRPQRRRRSDRVVLRAAVVARSLGHRRSSGGTGDARAAGARARRDRRASAATSTRSRSRRCSGWRAAAACSATTSSTASASA